MDAYKLGIIDSKGNFLKKSEDLRTDKERKAVDIFNRLIINLKKLVKKVPDPRLQAQLKNVATAMILIKEESERLGADGNMVVYEIKRYLSTQGLNVDEITLNNSFEELLEEDINDE